MQWQHSKDRQEDLCFLQGVPDSPLASSLHVQDSSCGEHWRSWPRCSISLMFVLAPIIPSLGVFFIVGFCFYKETKIHPLQFCPQWALW